jgi:hypothetical protein
VTLASGVGGLAPRSRHAASSAPASSRRQSPHSIRYIINVLACLVGAGAAQRAHAAVVVAVVKVGALLAW